MYAKVNQPLKYKILIFKFYSTNLNVSPPITPYVICRTAIVGENILIMKANALINDPAIPTGLIPNLLTKAPTMGPVKEKKIVVTYIMLWFVF